MNKFLMLIKMNIKLLLRNKGFLFFLCITPIVSAVILGIKAEHTLYKEEVSEPRIIELEKCTERAVYVSDTSTFIVKVYDGSKTEISEYVLNELAESGMFTVCRCDVRNMTEEEVLEQAKKDAFDDRAGTLLYLKEDFDAYILKGDYAGAFQIYDVSEDERWELFETELSSVVVLIHQLAENGGMDGDKITEMLETVDEEMPRKEIVSLSGKDDIALTKEQDAYKSNIGYAMAIITLGFLFCGVCVAYTVIEEQNNKVYTRMMLSKASRTEYLASKLIMTVIISALQTFVLGICIFVVKDMDFGISKVSFLGLMFLLGLIFSSVSLLVGVLLGEVMSANYTVFSVWSISALLAGLYFPLDDTTAVLKSISNLMPQKWFMRASEMLLVGDKSAYSMVICITVAYLVVIMSVGAVGLKVKRSDS